MSIFESTTPGSGDANPGAVPATPDPTPPADSGGAAVTPPVEGQPVVEAPTPQYLDLDQYGTHLVKLKVDGEDVDVPLSEAREGFMRQQAFTKRMQELAEDRRRLGQADALVSALEANPADTLKQLAEAYDLDPTGGFIPVQRAPEEQRLVEQQRQLAQMQQQLTQQTIQSEINAIRATDPNVDVQALAQLADSHGVTLTVAHQLQQFQALQAQQQKQQGNDAARQAAIAAQVVHSGGSTAQGSVTQQQGSASTIREAWARAKAATRT